ncbi:MAG TPA: hypothetical protein VFZ57_09910 [Thermoanaerobaculia bacterium]|nr:hypothetical protein [Thermoanaerobaculia bacterium]
MNSPWLFGRRADLLLFGGSTALALLFLGIGHAAGLLDGDAPPWLFLVAVVGVDVAHVWATGWRVLADGRAARARLALYLGVPLAAWAAGVVAYSVSALFFWRVLAYLAVFHFVRQQYGWVALYRRKNGEGGDGRLLDAAAIYGATLTPLLFWHAHLPRRFQWFLRGDFVNGLPEGVSRVAFVLYAGIFAAWAVKEVARSRVGRVSWGKVLIVLSTAATWFLGIVVFDSDYAFTVTNVFVHGIPYMGLVWFTSKLRAQGRRDAGDSPSFADRMALNVAFFLAPLLLVAFAEEWGWDRLVWHDHAVLFPGPALDPGALLLALIVPLLALPQATHYVWDAFLWKVRPENRGTVEALGIR